MAGGSRIITAMRAEKRTMRARRRVAVTALGVVVAGVVLALLLVILSGLYDHSLDRVKTRQAVALIATLDRAVRAYADAGGTHPPGSPDAGLRRVLPTLLSVPESRKHLAELTPALLFLVDGQPRCQDPWGRPIRCLTDRAASAAFRDRVQRNHGVPVFESAGPDRDFGDNSDARQADNVRSDEPLDTAGPTFRPAPASSPGAGNPFAPGPTGS